MFGVFLGRSHALLAERSVVSAWVLGVDHSQARFAPPPDRTKTLPDCSKIRCCLAASRTFPGATAKPISKAEAQNFFSFSSEPGLGIYYQLRIPLRCAFVRTGTICA